VRLHVLFDQSVSFLSKPGHPGFPLATSSSKLQWKERFRMSACGAARGIPWQTAGKRHHIGTLSRLNRERQLPRCLAGMELAGLPQ
jgi:hypothetical protein